MEGLARKLRVRDPPIHYDQIHGAVEQHLLDLLAVVDRHPKLDAGMGRSEGHWLSDEQLLCCFGEGSSCQAPWSRSTEDLLRRYDEETPTGGGALHPLHRAV